MLQVRQPYNRIYRGSLEFTIDTLNKKKQLLVFSPTLDANILRAMFAECRDEGRSQTSICNQRDIQVNGCTAEFITIGQFSCGKILVDIDHKLDLAIMRIIKGR